MKNYPDPINLGDHGTGALYSTGKSWFVVLGNSKDIMNKANI